jgi:hypothetical protein
MTRDGHPVTPGLAACMSPYIRGHIRGFGRYFLDMADVPPQLNPGPYLAWKASDLFLHVCSTYPHVEFRGHVGAPLSHVLPRVANEAAGVIYPTAKACPTFCTFPAACIRCLAQRKDRINACRAGLSSLSGAVYHSLLHLLYAQAQARSGGCGRCPREFPLPSRGDRGIPRAAQFLGQQTRWRRLSVAWRMSLPIWTR